ncbi:AfsR/SARP family transcriptional regulator [Streptomyces sp. NPDC003691]
MHEAAQLLVLRHRPYAVGTTKGDSVKFCVLGPVEVWLEGRRLPPFARKPTALLTAGLLDAGSVVPVDRLIEAIWGTAPPTTAAKLVQSYIARMRQALHRAGAHDTILTCPGGYLFQPEAGALDLARFQNLVDRGRAEAARGEYGSAAETLDAGLRLWRGPALGSPATWVLQIEATRLEEMRLATVEAMLEARLESGDPARTVGELTRLVAEFPLRERLRALLMTALERAGRRADALRVYREGHRQLRAELGIEPGRELKDLHTRLLTADSAPAEAIVEQPRRAVALEPARQPVLPGADGAGAPPPPPAQLPAAVQRLTGREAEAARLESVLLNGGQHATVCVVHGMPGIGKTALALHTAHRLTAHFPDGRLYADLHGSDPAGAADPSEIAAGFLRALGTAPGRIPAAFPERAAAFRTLLAKQRILVVLDDAAGERQIRELLPGAGSRGAVLITSRRALPGLDAVERVAPRILNSCQTLELLARLTGRSRVAAEPRAAAEIARLSGGLPLAVRIIGSRLGARRRWPLRVLADRLSDEHTRLSELACGDLGVRSAIGISYRALPEPESRVLRRLAVLESPDFAPWVAAPLAAVGLPEAERLVDRLADAHLLEPLGADGTGQVRYRFHELVRLYARERAEHEEAADHLPAAVSRLLQTWLALIRAIGPAESAGVLRTVPEGSDSTLAARLLRDPGRWLEAEQDGLVAAVELAVRLDLREEACGLASALVDVTNRVSTRFDAWRSVEGAAPDPARPAGPPVWRGPSAHRARAVVLRAGPSRRRPLTLAARR